METFEIVQVVRNMHPGGGVGGVVFALDAAWRARGVATRAITAESLGLSRSAQPGRLRASLEIVQFSWKATLAVRRAQRGGAVVVVHGDALGGDIYVDHGLHKALLARRPWLLAHPLHLFIAAREELRHALFRRTRVASLSALGAARLQRAYPLRRRTPAAQLANGVDLDRFRPDPAHLSAPVRLADLRLAFVGHEFGRKGLRHVLEAMSHLPAGVHLEVVGGRERERAGFVRRAERLGIAGRVAFLGVRDDVETVLRRSHLMVLPSCLEAFPLVALEAMACGAPVLLSGVPAAPELIGADEAGRVVQPSGRAIAVAVREITADPLAFTALRHTAVARARRFAWAEVAQAYVALAEDVRRARAAARR